MIYAEGVLIALAAPMLALLLVVGQRTRRLLTFQVTGMVVCLLAAYINSFLAYIQGLNDLDAVLVVAPMVEEIAKYLPLAFFVMVFAPTPERIVDAAIAIGVGYATYENACYLLLYGAQGMDMAHLALRGLAVGAMHTSCTALVGLSLSRSRQSDWPRFNAMAGVLCIAIAYHAVYNTLASYPPPINLIGYALPITVALAVSVYHLRQVSAHRTWAAR